MGNLSLNSNVGSAANTALGNRSLLNNVSGSQNSGVGGLSLLNNQGSSNTAVGQAAGQLQSSGDDNTYIGRAAGMNQTSGDGNFYIGEAAGINQTTGSDNIYMNHDGVAGEDNTIRIGDGSIHDHAFIAGIRGTTTGVADVVIDSQGQLGTVSSSQRYKEDIQDMNGISEKLLALRPVTFRYKQPSADGSQPIQFGLIAEEVAKVFPELVVYGKDGQVETVQYFKLIAILLNELKKQHGKLEVESDKNLAQESTMQAQAEQLEQLQSLLTLVQRQYEHLQALATRLANMEAREAARHGDVVHTGSP